MADDTDNLVLEHLRHIRRAVDRIEFDVGELKTRVSSLEAGLATVQVQLAGHSARFDRLEERVSRIERRLELTESHS